MRCIAEGFLLGGTQGDIMDWRLFSARIGMAGRLAALALLLLVSWPALIRAQTAVCAEVRIEIRQKLNLERQAFDALLRIRNGLSMASVDAVQVDVLFADEEGNPVMASSDPNNTAATFFIRLDALDGIAAVDGSGSVAPQSTATVRWIIIPSADAGGNRPHGRLYMIGARLQYRINGEEKHVDVMPETITVRPQPRLALDYFLAGDVYSDDPFTPDIEPAIPFTLGLRIRNSGAGSGHGIRMESAQPRIVDNAQGLLVGFNIVGSHVDEMPAAPTLKIDFGDIPAGGVRMGRWLMEATLSGRFVSMDARYTHADALGGALTSLIDGEPGVHLLLRDVLVELPGRDGIRDFLARDEDVLRVYESNGVDSEVVDRSDSARLVPVSGIAGQYSLHVPTSIGFSYVRLPDPLQGNSARVSVRRRDGQLLRPENAWLSKTRRSDLSWERHLNVFDAEGGGDYVVVFDAPPSESVLMGEVYSDTNGNGLRDADEPGLAGVELQLSGAAGQGQVHRTSRSQHDGRYRFADLPGGLYSIAVADLASYGNGVHRAGTAGGVVGAASIARIELGEAVSAEGYVFAKLPVNTQPNADLQILALDAQTSVAAGEMTTVAIQVQNMGPQAALAHTFVRLPEGFSVEQALPTAGHFDAATGIWEHGALVPGQQQHLALQGQYSQQGTWLLGAEIKVLGESPVDPDASNDQSQREVMVHPPARWRVSLEPAPVTDVLFWVSCPEGAAPECAQDRARRWSALLAGSGVRHRVETDAASFVAALRTGDWPSVWVDGGQALAQDTIAAEIRESVRRGGSLVLSGERHDEWAGFEALAGVEHVSSLSAEPRVVNFMPSEYFAEGALDVQGPGVTYAVTTGRVLARYESGMAAVAGTPVQASASIIIFGFDPLSGLEALTAPGSFIAGLMEGAAVSIRDVVLDKSRLAWSARASRHRASSGELILTAGFPEAFGVLAADPAPTSSAPGSLTWTVPLPQPDSTFAADYVVRAPAGSGLQTFTALVHWQDEEDEDRVEVHIRDLSAQSAVSTDALAQLQALDTGEAELKRQAMARLQVAQSAYEQGQQIEATHALLEALAALDGMRIEAARDVAVELSRLLLAMLREPREVAEPTLFANGFEEAP